MSTLPPAASTSVGREIPFTPSLLMLWADLGLGGLIALLALSSGPRPTLVGDLLLILALMCRTARPPVAAALATAGGLALVATSTGPTLGLLAVPLVTYSVARWAPRLVQCATAAVLLGGSVAGPLRWTRPNPELATLLVLIFTCAVTAAAAFAFGLVLRAYATSRQTRERALRAAELHILQQREQQSRYNTAAERARIARELHDIVAHSLAVILVQAEGARAVLARRPELAGQALDTIAGTSRESLAEMRRMVQLLRGETPDAAEYVPTAGLADIADLVTRTGNARLIEQGPPQPAPAALQLAAYRIVQESLTNVLKHAGPSASARVILEHRPTGVSVEVSDDGRGAAVTSDGLGNGIRGMRERVALHGGTLHAGPHPGGGFVVRAWLPLPTPGSAVPAPASPASSAVRSEQAGTPAEQGVDR